jgi:tetratricopeptide (TPR) repeat protein
MNSELPFSSRVADRLKGWKRIAGFFGVDERTVKRWEASRGLPVYRAPGRQKAGVYADPVELAGWLKGDPGGQVGAGDAVAAHAVRADLRLFENVPPRNLAFTGRAASLALLHDGLHRPGDGFGARRVAVHGLGGIGKTTLAVEYAYRHADAYACVWWAPATHRAVLVESLAMLAGRVDPQLSAAADKEKAAVAGLARLAHLSGPPLLIYDDVQSPEMLRDLVPASGGHVILTSRWADWEGQAVAQRLDLFGEEVAIEFLQRRAGRGDPGAARRLAAALGRLPLALDHAGAYCRLTASSFDTYRERIERRIAQAPRGVLYPASVAATFGIMIDTAAKQHRGAEALLGALSYLSPEDIPLDLTHGLMADEDDHDEAMGALSSVSLIDHHTAEDGGATVSIHPLVQAAMRRRVAEQGAATVTCEQVVAWLEREFPKPVLISAFTDPAAQAKSSALFGHALTLVGHAENSAAPCPGLSGLLRSMAIYAHTCGDYAGAETMLRRASAIAEKSGDARMVAELGFNLGRVLFITDRLVDAEALFRRTIVDGETDFGRDHLAVAVRLGLLADLLHRTGRQAEAELLYQEIIAVADREANEASPYDVIWRIDYGILLDETGRFDEAERLGRETLDRAVRKLGPRHPEYARGLNNLGRTLRDMERFEEAADSIRRALAIWRQLPNINPTYVARAQHNLARALLRLGHAEEALDLIEQALAVHQAILGLAHFWTVQSAQCYAVARAATGRTDAAANLRASVVSDIEGGNV